VRVRAEVTLCVPVYRSFSYVRLWVLSELGHNSVRYSCTDSYWSMMRTVVVASRIPFQLVVIGEDRF